MQIVNKYINKCLFRNAKKTDSADRLIMETAKVSKKFKIIYKQNFK